MVTGKCLPTLVTLALKGMFPALLFVEKLMVCFAAFGSKSNVFFGRLKCLWGIFSEKWTLEEGVFDRVFDVAYALTNIDIFNRPLREDESEFNNGIHNAILLDLQMKALRQKRANEEYNRRRRRELDNESPESSTEEFVRNEDE